MSGEVDVDGLRRAAEAATPGPWSAMDDVGDLLVYDVAVGNVIADLSVGRQYNTDTAAMGSVDAAYIAAASPDVVLALLDQLAEMRRLNRQLENDVERVTATVARAQRVVAMYDNVDAIVPQEWPTMGEAIVNALRDALDSQRHTGTPDASQAADGPLSASEGHVSATDLAQAAARTKQAARERVGRGEGLG